jgi:hypothetical protein
MIEIIKHEHSNDLLKEIALIALDKNVYKELGYPIFSDKNHTWYLLYLDNILTGFCASVFKGKHYSFNHDYILKKYRGMGYYKVLFNKRMQDYKNSYIKAAATKDSLNTFLRFGFKIIRETKNYTFLDYGKN